MSSVVTRRRCRHPLLVRRSSPSPATSASWRPGPGNRRRSPLPCRPPRRRRRCFCRPPLPPRPRRRRRRRRPRRRRRCRRHRRRRCLCPAVMTYLRTADLTYLTSRAMEASPPSVTLSAPPWAQSPGLRLSRRDQSRRARARLLEAAARAAPLVIVCLAAKAAHRPHPTRGADDEVRCIARGATRVLLCCTSRPTAARVP